MLINCPHCDAVTNDRRDECCWCWEPLPTRTEVSKREERSRFRWALASFCLGNLAPLADLGDPDRPGRLAALRFHVRSGLLSALVVGPCIMLVTPSEYAWVGIVFSLQGLGMAWIYNSALSRCSTRESDRGDP